MTSFGQKKKFSPGKRMMIHEVVIIKREESISKCTEPSWCHAKLALDFFFTGSTFFSRARFFCRARLLFYFAALDFFSL